MVRTLEMTERLCDVCLQYNVDVASVITIFELMGGLSPEQTQRVLYQASIVAAAEKIANGKGQDIKL